MSLLREIFSGPSSSLPSSERSFYSTLESLHKKRLLHLQKIFWLAESIGLSIELDTDAKHFEAELSQVAQQPIDPETGIVQAILDHLSDLDKLYRYRGYDEVQERIGRLMQVLREKLRRR